ncbi:heptaprenyl diphosphate synthase component I [[Bacteroides] pectinophilus ATCC 43243]|uniref:Heptaprenyl diphosphate synthase component I n=1 Tax=[Bacteroides] pectinophilus ATCC 43243 TaxID=483218 RepID=B7ATV8_9FIRM|nr:heptaprenyl diphosphate synthase component I [[Bacteroides] pectinophilus ATCC 43243]
MKKNSRLVAFCGIFTALAMIFSYVEMLLPISIGVPGAKLGLANIAVLVVLYVAGGRTAFCVDILRIVLTSILFGNMAAFIFSISGGMLSIIVMILLKKSGRFSMLGVSVAGGTAHNIGQIAAAAVVVGTAKIAYYLPVLLITGVITGIVNGCVARIIKISLQKTDLMILYDYSVMEFQIFRLFYSALRGIPSFLDISSLSFNSHFQN